MAVASRQSVKVADEVWIAAALLHREQTDREEFTIDEIVDRARQEAITETLRTSVRVHAALHCVANRQPSPARYRMLSATGKNTRRLFRPGDPYHREREGAKTTPNREEIPERYHTLLDWYRTDYVARTSAAPGRDPILGLRGLGREIWRGEKQDEYVRHLREGWD